MSISLRFTAIDSTQRWQKHMSKIPEEIENSFFERTDGFELKFFLNDCIRVIGKEGAKSIGSVVGIQEFEPEQKYHVEYSDSTFATLPASKLMNFDAYE